MRTFKIQHITRYDYSEWVTLLPHRLLMRPREGFDVRLDAWQLTIEPAYTLYWQRDIHSNVVGVIQFSAPSPRLFVASDMVVSSQAIQPLDFWVDEAALYYPFSYEESERQALQIYLTPVFWNDYSAITQWLHTLWQPTEKIQTYTLLERFNQAIARDFQYVVREAPRVQTPAETLFLRSGSCRDYATLFIETCRVCGIAARFVSGYIYSPATVWGHGSTHAWSEVYLPGVGWKGFDSTSGQLVGMDHIAVAVSHHPEAISPLSGSFLSNQWLTPASSIEVQVNLAN